MVESKVSPKLLRVGTWCLALFRLLDQVRKWHAQSVGHLLAKLDARHPLIFLKIHDACAPNTGNLCQSFLRKATTLPGFAEHIDQRAHKVVSNFFRLAVRIRQSQSPMNKKWLEGMSVSGHPSHHPLISMPWPPDPEASIKLNLDPTL